MSLSKGDVVGIAIDLDSNPKRLLYCVNGEYNVASKNIDLKNHDYVFPTLAAASPTEVCVNFGQTKFAYSPPDNNNEWHPWNEARVRPISW